MKAQTTTAEEFITLNKTGRATLQLASSIGVNAFGSFVGARNINVNELTLLQKYSGDICEALKYSDNGEAMHYVTAGAGGLNGGTCERFTFLLEERDVNIYAHANGKGMISAALIKGTRFIDDKELRELIVAGEIRRFTITSQESGKQVTHEGALLGDMSEKRQALVTVGASGALVIVSLTTGKIGVTEKADRAVEAGALTDAEKLALRARLMGGADIAKGKTIARNASRKARKATLKG